MGKINQSSISFVTRQVVSRQLESLPYVGFERTDDQPDGWLHDIKRWCSPFDLRLPSLPKFSDPGFQGVSESEYFKSGVGSVKENDIILKSIVTRFVSGERQWIPLLKNGWYFRHKAKHFLYSDNSRVEYIDPDENEDSRNYIELNAKPDILSPITAATYKRNSMFGTPFYYSNPAQRYNFTGLYQDGEELETVSTMGKIFWDRVDTTKREFIVDHTRSDVTVLRFNKEYTKSFGVVPTVHEDLGACEEIGISNGQEYMNFKLVHFPVLANDDFHLYITNSATSTWEEWDRVETWNELLNTTWSVNKKFFLDKDYGTIWFGTFANGGVPPLGYSILATYTTTLRVEYEEQNQDDCVLAIDADVNPVSQQTNQGFVFITHEISEPTNISLSINKAPISFSSPLEYGPLYVGSDYAVFKTLVSNQMGLPMKNVQVGFAMTPSSTGALDGSSSSTRTTSGRGEAFSTYQPPISADSMGHYSTIVRTSNHASYLSGYKDIILSETAEGLIDNEEQIYVYQILKDDLFLGYSNLDDYLENEVERPAWVSDPDDLLRWKEEMILTYDLQDWEGVQSDGTISGRKVVIYQLVDNQVAYPNLGTPNYDPSAINPVTGELGAIVPLKPLLVEKITDGSDDYFGRYRLIYPEDAIPDPDPNDENILIGGYWVVSSKIVEFQSQCFSSYYNTNIYSNKISVRVSLPNYLLGEYVADNLESIPYGWKFLSDLDGVASGFDGATFITINPFSGPYQVLDLVNDEDPEDAPDGWASAPFKSIGFTFDYIREV